MAQKMLQTKGVHCSMVSSSSVRLCLPNYRDIVTITHILRMSHTCCVAFYCFYRILIAFRSGGEWAIDVFCF